MDWITTATNTLCGLTSRFLSTSSSSSLQANYYECIQKSFKQNSSLLTSQPVVLRPDTFIYTHTVTRPTLFTTNHPMHIKSFEHMHDITSARFIHFIPALSWVYGATAREPRHACFTIHEEMDQEGRTLLCNLQHHLLTNTVPCQ